MRGCRVWVFLFVDWFVVLRSLTFARSTETGGQVIWPRSLATSLMLSSATYEDQDRSIVEAKGFSVMFRITLGEEGGLLACYVPRAIFYFPSRVEKYRPGLLIGGVCCFPALFGVQLVTYSPNVVCKGNGSSPGSLQCSLTTTASKQWLS